MKNGMYQFEYGKIGRSLGVNKIFQYFEVSRLGEKRGEGYKQQNSTTIAVGGFYGSYCSENGIQSE